MQLTREIPAAHVIRAWEAGRIRIGDRWIEGNVIVSADRIIPDWPVHAANELAAPDFAAAIELAPEIILLGTGAGVLLPDVDLMGALATQAIGLEIMSTPAACRTFNVLVQERRRVVAALINAG